MNIQLFRTLFSKNLTPGLLFGARKGLSERNFGRNGFLESGKHPSKHFGKYLLSYLLFLLDCQLRQKKNHHRISDQRNYA